MQTARQLGSGLFYALISVVLVVGGLSLALAEGNGFPPSTSTPSATSLQQTFTPLPSTQTGIPPTIQPINPSQTQVTTASTTCNPPYGWTLIIVQPGETLSSVSALYKLTPEELAKANCLSAQILLPGSGIFVPPPLTSTTISCGPFPGWIRGYVVQPGDTLFHIATTYRTTVGDMEIANCKSKSTVIFAGERLWVPNVATITPGVTLIPVFDTPTEFPTEPLTLTPLPFTDTPFPTYTNEPNPSVTPTP